MPQNISKKPKQDQLEALTYGAGAQFNSHPPHCATFKDLERELRSEDKHSGQPSTPTKANDKSRHQPVNEETQAEHLHRGDKKPNHSGDSTKGGRKAAHLDPLPRLQREGDHDIHGTRSGGLANGSRNTSSKEAQRKNASSLGYISGNGYEGES
ncbi:MAG: hypothetical protein OHK93_005845 [Ramalina farinacea]|uniref:Uncharacterized protein n=1 Tax=Ramalina farinacea TaxID=258253 RepID=A0AA43QHF5_9LECA|nr:hypothetical protein [Ramalina farinacea]